MKKTVASIIASSRALIKSPSTQDLPDEVLRLFVHNALEEMTLFAVNEKPDFLTNESLLDLSYDSDALGYEFSLDLNDSVHDIHVVKMYCQPAASDPQEDGWEEVRFVKYKNYPAASGENRIVACMFGNDFDGLQGKRIRFNRSDDWVSQYRFRVGFRVVLGKKLKYADFVPFPSQHTTLLEYIVAAEALPLVNDISPEFASFASRQSPRLEGKVMEKKIAFSQWLKDDIDSVTIVTARPFNYRSRNQLKGRGLRPYRIED
jgi:hypothetical protein